MLTRIASYWHNGRSLGHTARAAAICSEILKTVKNSTVLGITGASHGLHLLPYQMDVVKVPSYLAYDSKEGATTIPKLLVTKKEFQIYRETLISSTLEMFQPDVFIVDYHPQGKKCEIVPALLKLSNSSKILGLRGILGNSEETNHEFFNNRMTSFIERTYDAIHVYTDPDIICLDEIYTIPSVLKKMITYTGYVTRTNFISKSEARNELGIDNQSRVVVVSFGGGQATGELWRTIVRSLSKMSNLVEHVYLILGPYLEQADKIHIQTIIRNYLSWQCYTYIDYLAQLIAASDLFIGSAGYNTISEIMAIRPNALLIPRQLSEQEQTIHANRFADKGIFRISSIKEFLEKSQTIIEQCIKEPLEISGDISIKIDGAKRSAELIQEIVSGG